MTLNKQHFWFTLLGAAITTGFGILLIVNHGILERICLWTGAVFGAVGAALCILYFATKRQNRIPIIYGLVCLVLGVLLCIIPSVLKFLVPILFGLWILGSAGSGLFKNIAYRKYLPYWWVGMLLCLIGVGVGVFIITRPTDTMDATIRCIGIGMTIHGILRFISAFMGKKAYSGEVIDTSIEG